MHQLIIPYQKKIEFTFNNYFNDKNKDILNHIRSIFHNTLSDQIYIWSSEASGKTHILNAACNYHSKDNKRCVYIPLREYKNLDTEIFSNIESFDLICIDDIQSISKNSKWELSLFNLYNRAKDESSKIIFSGNCDLKDCSIELNDLNSRLKSGLSYYMQESDDITKEMILLKIIKEYEYNISSDIPRHLLIHYSRNLNNLIKNIHVIGEHSLSTNKKVHIRSLYEIL